MIAATAQPAPDRRRARQLELVRLPESELLKQARLVRAACADLVEGRGIAGDRAGQEAIDLGRVVRTVFMRIRAHVRASPLMPTPAVSASRAIPLSMRRARASRVSTVVSGTSRRSAIWRCDRPWTLWSSRGSA